MRFRQFIQKRWYHATSRELALKIMTIKVIYPGMPSHYRIDIPRQDAVYLTSDLKTAKGYALERNNGVVFEVKPQQEKLIPDEDAVWDLLYSGQGSLSKQLRKMWFEYKNLNLKQGGQKPYSTFSSAWNNYLKTVDDWDAEMSSELSSDMKILVDVVVEKNKQLADAIIATSDLAAHLGPVPIVGPVAI